jgi:hypothetical protein
MNVLPIGSLFPRLNLTIVHATANNPTACNFTVEIVIELHSTGRQETIICDEIQIENLSSNGTVVMIAGDNCYIVFVCSRERMAIPEVIYERCFVTGRSRWSCVLRYSSAVARLLRTRVWIPLRAWMLVSCIRCVLYRYGLLRRRK